MSVLGKEINYIYKELVHCKHNVKPSLFLKHRQDWIILWDCMDRIMAICLLVLPSTGLH